MKKISPSVPRKSNLTGRSGRSGRRSGPPTVMTMARLRCRSRYALRASLRSKRRESSARPAATMVSSCLSAISSRCSRVTLSCTTRPSKSLSQRWHCRRRSTAWNGGAEERDQRFVQRGAEGEEDALAARRDGVPVVEAELALVREGHLEARRRAGRAALVQPLLGGAIGVNRDVLICPPQRMRGDEAGDPRADDGDVSHWFLSKGAERRARGAGGVLATTTTCALPLAPCPLSMDTQVRQTRSSTFG